MTGVSGRVSAPGACSPPTRRSISTTSGRVPRRPSRLAPRP